MAEGIYKKASEMPSSLPELCEKWGCDMRDDDGVEEAYENEARELYIAEDKQNKYLIRNPLCWTRRFAIAPDGTSWVARPEPIFYESKKEKEKQKKDYKDNNFNF